MATPAAVLERTPHGGAELGRMESAERYNGWLFERARPHVGRAALDVGAGIGTFTSFLAQTADTVVAAEPDVAEASLLRGRFSGAPNVTVVNGTVADVDGAFDSALCFNVLEHVRDHVGALRDVHARLRPGGKLCVLVPAHPALFGAVDRAVSHERRYDRRTLGSALGSAGFDVAELRHVNPVGALGWLVSSKLLRRSEIPAGPLALYDRFVPVFRALDALRLPFGLSLWAVAVRS
ncbi:MAG: class I SAM-dependent methyltransferase [Gaiellaceae bacterium]